MTQAALLYTTNSEPKNSKENLIRLINSQQ